MKDYKYIYAWPRLRRNGGGYRYNTDDGLKAYLAYYPHEKGRSKYTLSQPGRSYPIKTAADVKKWVRQIKPEHETALQENERAIAKLQAERKALMKTAFQKGWVVTLKQVQEVAEANEVIRQERRRELEQDR